MCCENTPPHFVVFLPISKAIYCRLRQIILRALAKAQNPAIMENEQLGSTA
jgi:hypothetical protein